MDYIHTTDFIRTKKTAQPTAEMLNIKVEIYNPRELKEFASKLKNTRGRHLVVGHSNTIPELVKLLGGEPGTPIVDHIEAADGSGTIKYRLIKEPKQKWNVIIGGQYQLNKHHQFRAEGGIIGNRKSLLLSYNYRFGI